MLSRTKKLLFSFVVITCLALWLSGCAQCPSSPPPVSCVTKLMQQGVQVIRTGETYTIVIPTDSIFYPDSANFKPGSDLILNPLVCFLGDYETTIMRVAGYLDNQGSHVRNMALSKKQAESVVEYLTEQELDVRVMYAQGFDSYHPVADNETEKGRAENRRIEIRFRKVVIPPI
jgi:outer membrane protein OmpA-like peptidoglycan-associated protein